MDTGKNVNKFSLHFLCALGGLAAVVLFVGFEIYSNMDATVDRKKSLPDCTRRELKLSSDGTYENEVSLHTRLAEIGEVPWGIGVENSKLSREQGAVTLSFTYDPKTDNWSFLTTNTKQITCFAAVGTNWIWSGKKSVIKKTAGQTDEEADMKGVGYSAPLEQMKRVLSLEGKELVGFGNRIMDDLEKSPYSYLVTYLFVNKDDGAFSAVTNVILRDNKGEYASIEATGLKWEFGKKYFAQ